MIHTLVLSWLPPFFFFPFPPSLAETESLNSSFLSEQADIDLKDQKLLWGWDGWTEGLVKHDCVGILSLGNQGKSHACLHSLCFENHRIDLPKQYLQT